MAIFYGEYEEREEAGKLNRKPDLVFPNIILYEKSN